MGQDWPILQGVDSLLQASQREMLPDISFRWVHVLAGILTAQALSTTGILEILEEKRFFVQQKYYEREEKDLKEGM